MGTDNDRSVDMAHLAPSSTEDQDNKPFTNQAVAVRRPFIRTDVKRNVIRTAAGLAITGLAVGAVALGWRQGGPSGSNYENSSTPKAATQEAYSGNVRIDRRIIDQFTGVTALHGVPISPDDQTFTSTEPQLVQDETGVYLVIPAIVNNQPTNLEIPFKPDSQIGTDVDGVTRVDDGTIVSVTNGQADMPSGPVPVDSLGAITPSTVAPATGQ